MKIMYHKKQGILQDGYENIEKFLFLVEILYYAYFYLFLYLYYMGFVSDLLIAEHPQVQGCAGVYTGEYGVEATGSSFN